MDTILSPLLYLVSWVMIGWHWLFSQVLGDSLSWTLSIVGLVVVIRSLLIPLFVRQIKASRKLQMIQPQVKELQKKYGHDRERMTQETMKLYKESGTNPLSSCLPILIQSPFFFALFRVVDGIAVDTPRGAFADDPALFQSAKTADFFGIPDVNLVDKFVGADTFLVQAIAILMVAVMTATTFLTQRQLMRKNMPAAALSGPYAQQQKILLYVLPLVFAVSGVAFPLGVVLYWCTSNIWTMCQQFYVIRRMPAPGSPAEEAMRKRTQAKAVRRGHLAPHADGSATVVVPPAGKGAGDPPSSNGNGTAAARASADGQAPKRSSPARQQPRRTTRADRRRRPG